MSHGDQVRTLPPGYRAIGKSDNAHHRRIPPRVAADLRRAVPSRGRAHARAAPRSSPTSCSRVCRRRTILDAGCVHRDARARRSPSGSESSRVIAGLSGGVDSAVAAALVHRAIGDRADLHLRRHRAAPTRGARAGRAHIPAASQHPAGDRGRGVALSRARWRASTIRKQKRRIIGHTFIDVFEDAAREVERAPGRAGRVPGAGHTLSRTSSSRCRRAAARRRRSRPITTWAASSPG